MFTRGRTFRIGLWLGILAAAGFAIARVLRSRRDSEAADRESWSVVDPPSPSIPGPTPVVPVVEPDVVEIGDVSAPGEPEVGTDEPAPPAAEVRKAAPARRAAPKRPPTKKAAAKRVAPSWVDPDGRLCPQTHPVKAKLSSKLFHLPGMFAYDRTNPDRCYKSAAAAEADGLRAAKR